jgi:hypothetical protein
VVLARFVLRPRRCTGKGYRATRLWRSQIFSNRFLGGLIADTDQTGIPIGGATELAPQVIEINIYAQLRRRYLGFVHVTVCLLLTVSHLIRSESKPGTRHGRISSEFAIRPYKEEIWSPKGELAEVLIRPIRRENEPLMARFHATLSEHSVYLRYFHMMPLDSGIAHERLARICFPDTDRELVLVAERRDPATEEREILAVARLSKEDQAKEAEFGVLTGDKFSDTDWERSC